MIIIIIIIINNLKVFMLGPKTNWIKENETVLHLKKKKKIDKWAASSKFGTYRLCEQRRFRGACAAQSRENLRYSLIQVVSQEEPSDRKPDP